MTHFLRLLNEDDKCQALDNACERLRHGKGDSRAFNVETGTFDAIPGAPFAYWVSDSARNVFLRERAFEQDYRWAEHGGSTKDDFRFLRLWWEVIESPNKWVDFAKGGAYSSFYSDIHLLVNWKGDARELEAALLHKYPYLGRSANWVLHRECSYYHPGITWTSRTASGLSLRALPAGCIFAHKGPAAFVSDDDPIEILALIAITNSQSFRFLVSLQIAVGSYEVGVIQRTPVPHLKGERRQLADLARTAWSLKRTLDTTTETSHAFLLPATLRRRLSDFDATAIESELNCVQAEIDSIAFELYGFSEGECDAPVTDADETDAGERETEAAIEGTDASITTAPLSWALGVAFGRFDWRLATGERTPPSEPEPFEPLPAKSPGMLPDGATPFHHHPGMLVDDPGHDHDLPRLVEAVLERVDASVDRDTRRWLRKDFFKYHLQQYSKSRRKAPIYWPLATESGDYTVWIYYPMLTGQTLFTAVNDFVEPKLQQVAEDIAALRQSGPNRSRQEEQRLAALVDFEAELAELRDTLLAMAPGYKPDQDDGVQITAAPLWRLFRHTAWRKVLQETWERLERGDYDWAKLAMAYWPERVRGKCVTDQSLAIAHDLEHLYEPPATGKKNKKS